MMGRRRTAAAARLTPAPSKLRESVTLSAIGCAKGKFDSAVTTSAYIITPPAAAPTFSPAPARYTGVQNVTLASTTPGATFRYTTDGSDPGCGAGTSYSDPIAIGNSLTLKAVACAAGFSDSPVTSGGYDITIPPPPLRCGQRRHQQSRRDSADLRGRHHDHQ